MVGLLVFPHFWVQSVIKRHADDRSDIPGTGGELARHLLDGMKLTDVKVESIQPYHENGEPGLERRSGIASNSTRRVDHEPVKAVSQKLAEDSLDHDH